MRTLCIATTTLIIGIIIGILIIPDKRKQKFTKETLYEEGPSTFDPDFKSSKKFSKSVIPDACTAVQIADQYYTYVYGGISITPYYVRLHNSRWIINLTSCGSDTLFYMEIDKENGTVYSIINKE